MFQCTAEELETYKNALRNAKTFVKRTSDHGNDVQLSPNTARRHGCQKAGLI